MPVVPMPNEVVALEKTPSADLVPDGLSYARGVYSSFPEGGPPDFYEVWRKLRRHLWLVVTLVVVITTLAAVVMLRTKSVYQAATVIEIGKDSGPVVRGAEVVLQNGDSEDAALMNIKTKMVMLKSQELLEDVVVDLRLDENPEFLDLKKQSWLSRLLRREGATPGRADVWRDSLAQALPRLPAESARLAPFVKALDEGLSVEQIKETRALRISYTHTTPAIAAVVANSIAEHFIRRNFEGKTERFTHTAAWLDRSTRELKAKVEQAEQSLANYTRENNIFSTEGHSTLTTDKLARLHDQFTRAETDRILKESLYEEVRQGRVAQVPEAFAEMSSKFAPKLTMLQKEYDDLKNSEAELAVHFGPENPKLQEVQQRMASLQGQIEASRRSLEDRLKVDYEHAIRDEQALRAALAQAKAAAVNENQAGIAYNILKQDVETARNLYTEFLQKANQSRIQVAEQFSSVRILDHAKEPTEASGPKRLLMILLCFFVSLIVGLGLAFARELFDNKIKGIEDVARFTQLPTLSIIPTFSPGQATRVGRSAALEGGRLQHLRDRWRDWLNAPAERLLPTNSWAMAVESYHTLRTALLHSTAGGPPKTVLITSGAPGDGKTTTLANTAISLAQIGAKVLLIDADLRRPMVHKILGVDNSHGLSTYLSRNVTLDGLIQQVHPNLSVLPSGPVPPNPANLIGAARMRSMLQMISAQYDHILIDSPPVSSVTDPIILSTLVEGVIIVVHGGRSTRELLRCAYHSLSNVGARVIGVVINNVALKASGYGYYLQHCRTSDVE